VLLDVECFFEVMVCILCWWLDVLLWFDVVVFEDVLAWVCDDDFDVLCEVVDVYIGDLFEGFYDEWLFEECECLC